MPFRKLLSLSPGLLLGVFSWTTACDPEPVQDTAPIDEHAVAVTDRAAIVYESIRVVDGDGVEISTRTTGELTAEIYQRAARPWSYLDERHVYHELTRSRELGDGRVEHLHQIFREDNPSPVVARPDAAPTRVNQALTELMRDEAMREAPETLVDIHLRLRDFPDWDIPLLPPATGMSPEDVRRTLADRQDAIAARAEMLDMYATDLVADLEKLGGEVVSRRPSSGWLFVRAPWSSLQRLVDHPDVSRVLNPDVEFKLLWDLGDGRRPGRLDADRYWTHNFDGSEPNPGRHNHGRISVGVIDNGFEDEACAFLDGANCTGSSRIRERFRCSNNPANFCEPLLSGANFAEADEDDHGTFVASVLLGDYTDDQGGGHQFDDPPNTQIHADAWESARSGMAPEALATLFAITDDSSNALLMAQVNDALDDSIQRSLDIVNMSLAFSGANCDPTPVFALEEEAENAYDDGILVLAGAGNTGGHLATSCEIQSPADLIKTLAVNSFDAANPDCEADYHNACLLGSASSRGGADVVVDGVVRTGALSGVDIVAPTNILRTTDAAGGFGGIRSGQATGTSTATPHVSGLAALVKDRYLAAGLSYINSPGRLYTILLTYTDRHASADPSNLNLDTHQHVVGSDPWYGLGRMTMRLGVDMGPWSAAFLGWSFTTATPDKIFFPFGATPMPAGTVLAKCVMTQVEDMSSKSDISNIDLILRTRMPDANGNCTSSGTLKATLQDVSFDSKSMVAFESSVSTLAGRCLEVTLVKKHVTSAGITTLTSCYHAGQQDDV